MSIRRIFIVLAAFTLTLGIYIPSAHAIDVPIGQSTWQYAGNGCKLRIEGRDVSYSPAYHSDGVPHTINGPMVSWSVLQTNVGGNTCLGVRVNYVVNCPSLFFFGWVFGSPEHVEDITAAGMVGKTFFMPFVVSNPTCSFFGMWFEVTSTGFNPRVCQVYDVVHGWSGDPCTGHGTGTAYDNPYIWWSNPF